MDLARLVLLVLSVSVLHAQTEFRGELEPDLFVPKIPQMVGEFLKVPADSPVLAGISREGDRVFCGKVAGHRACLIERDQGSVLLFDADDDGQFQAGDLHKLEKPEYSLHQGVAYLSLPLRSQRYRRYPIYVTVYREQREPDKRMVGESPRAYIEGMVLVSGRPVRVKYEVDRKTGKVDEARGWQGMDIDGDGVISEDLPFNEKFLARGSILVTQVGDYFLSTKSVNLERGEVVLRGHPASDAHQIDRRVGATVPDFTFVSLDGKRRKLSDFAGKHVLLDFWASWCGPCVAEVPNLQRVYAKYMQRGFVILGMNGDENPNDARELVAKRAILWPQARHDSIRDLIENRFRILSWPTYILLDGKRRIVESDAAKLRADALDAILTKCMPE